MTDRPPESDEKCVICGQVIEHGITIWQFQDGYAHPECVEGRRIDKED